MAKGTGTIIPRGGRRLGRSRTLTSMARAVTRAAGRMRQAARGGAALARGRTRTLTKVRRRVNIPIKPQAVGSTLSYFKKRYPMPRSFYPIFRTSQPRLRTDSGSAKFASSLNSQNYFSSRILHDGMIEDVYNNGLLSTDVASTAPGDLSILIRRVSLEMIFTNQSNVNVFVDIFECTCVQDHATSGTSAGGFALNQPTGMVDQGIRNLNSAQVNASTLGYLPYQSKMFKEFWRVDRSFTVELGQGRTHKHLSQFTVNKLVQKERIGLGDNYRFTTRAIMLRLRGSPVSSTADDTQVALSAAEVSIVTTRKIQYTVSNSIIGFATNANNLPNIADPRAMDEEGDIEAYTAT